MLAPRRYLPNLSWLLAAESVARTGSVSASAEELSLTQSAVSRQVQNLEAQLGIALFTRDRKRLRQTPAGAEYLKEARIALQQIANAGFRATSNPGGGVIELAVLPGFATHWLAPRLPRFLKAYPGITLNLTTRMRPFDFTSERFDAAISFGTQGWPGADHVALMDERVLPVASPAFVKDHPLNSPGDLLHVPLLRLQSRPRAWVRWLRAHEIEADPQGMMFDQFATMAQAAVHGLGVALLPDYMAEGALEDRSLTVVAGAPITSVGAYTLVWPAGSEDHLPLVALRDWLIAEAACLYRL